MPRTAEYLRLLVFDVVIIIIAVLYDVTTNSHVEFYQRFGGTWCHRLQSTSHFYIKNKKSMFLLK
jgi:hypothetical protein